MSFRVEFSFKKHNASLDRAADYLWIPFFLQKRKKKKEKKVRVGGAKTQNTTHDHTASGETPEKVGTRSNESEDRKVGPS